MYRLLLFCLLAMAVTSGFCKSNEKQIVEKTPWGKEVFTIPQFKNNDYVITDFGAKPEAEYNNQKHIQSAIDQCNKAGGGKVIVPAGTWLTGFLDMKSNVNLHLKAGATLLFSNKIEDYMVPTFTRWEGFECMNYHPLIYARNCQNIAISGKGKINGNGSAWWFMKKKQHMTLPTLYQQILDGVTPEKRNLLAYEHQSMLRPALIQFVGCKNILLKDFEVTSGPMWTVHMVYGENVIAQNIRVVTKGANNDGIIPDSCNKVLIDNCYFSTGDDCIVIKSGLNEDGWRVGKPSQHIVIKNCNTNHGHGGVVIGSEMSGGVNHVYAHDCNFSNTDRGLRIKSRIGRGGVIENLWFENITMNNIKNEAIKLNMHYGASSITPKSDKKPVFRNFYFKNIYSENSKHALHAKGISDQLIANMSFENMQLSSKYGMTIINAEKFNFKNISLKTKEEVSVKVEQSKDINFRKIKAEGAGKEGKVVLKGDNQKVKFKPQLKNISHEN
ncbi:glycoside hydrolase family 28 protein [Prolixibacteraceae bacterium JC049]|nr:glycoside hydrolase family 28 protein [Prolixibacteraceae bacterium JC049]